MNKDLLTAKSHQYIMCSNVMIKDPIESWLIRHDRAFKNQYRPGPIHEIRCPAGVNVSIEDAKVVLLTFCGNAYVYKTNVNFPVQCWASA